MTMPKKGSREITVDGKKYRWMVRKNMGVCPRRGPYLCLTVEDPETKSYFQKDFSIPPWQSQLGGSFQAKPGEVYKSIEPKDVEEFIRKVFSKAACEREREP